MADDERSGDDQERDDGQRQGGAERRRRLSNRLSGQESYRRETTMGYGGNHIGATLIQNSNIQSGAGKSVSQES